MRFAWVERIIVLFAGIVLAVLLIALLSGYFTSHDQPAVADGPGPGLQFASQGDQLIPKGSIEPLYDSDPPTSGPHVLSAIRRDGARLSNDQILSALSLGDVLFLYGSRQPPRGLLALATRLSGPFTRSLAASGLAVVLARRPGVEGVLALAWTRMLRSRTVDRGALTQFAQDWLGHGAGGSGPTLGPGS